MLGFLTREQIRAVIDVPTSTWIGHRDRLLLSLLYNTGARVSEITGIRVRDAVLGEAPCVHLHGKGRKQRSVPLWKDTAKDVPAWIKLNGEPSPESPLLRTRKGNSMTRANVAQRLQIAVAAATARRTGFGSLTISPHTIRHTTAMHLLQSGVDISVIALWLGHESTSTTHMYIEADLAMKERALARLTPPGLKEAQYRPPDALMRFLQAL
jgi:site-specific recombinase XerD